MRRSNEEAARTRARIVETAAAKFRRDGVVATGLNGLMRAAGLTHGGFYKHFESKDRLIAEAWREMTRLSLARVSEGARKRPPTERITAFITGYLSPDHRDGWAEGCGFAAIGPEIGRMSGDVRKTASEGFEAIAGALIELDPALPGGAGAARAATASMIGALICARAVGDQVLSLEILEDTRKSVLQLLCAGPPGSCVDG